jgi:hypothetical protein
MKQVVIRLKYTFNCYLILSFFKYEWSRETSNLMYSSASVCEHLAMNERCNCFSKKKSRVEEMSFFFA